MKNNSFKINLKNFKINTIVNKRRYGRLLTFILRRKYYKTYTIQVQQKNLLTDNLNLIILKNTGKQAAENFFKAFTEGYIKALENNE